MDVIMQTIVQGCVLGGDRKRESPSSQELAAHTKVLRNESPWDLQAWGLSVVVTQCMKAEAAHNLQDLRDPGNDLDLFIMNEIVTEYV